MINMKILYREDNTQYRDMLLIPFAHTDMRRDSSCSNTDEDCSKNGNVYL